jgi:hypothetical protein
MASRPTGSDRLIVAFQFGDLLEHVIQFGLKGRGSFRSQLRVSMAPGRVEIVGTLVWRAKKVLPKPDSL